MKKEFTNNDWSKKDFHYQLEYKKFVSFTLEDWLEYSGAGKIEHVSN